MLLVICYTLNASRLSDCTFLIRTYMRIHTVKRKDVNVHTQAHAHEDTRADTDAHPQSNADTHLATLTRRTIRLPNVALNHGGSVDIDSNYILFHVTHAVDGVLDDK